MLKCKLKKDAQAAFAQYVASFVKENDNVTLRSLLEPIIKNLKDKEYIKSYTSLAPGYLISLVGFNAGLFLPKIKEDLNVLAQQSADFKEGKGLLEFIDNILLVEDIPFNKLLVTSNSVGTTIYTRPGLAEGVTINGDSFSALEKPGKKDVVDIPLEISVVSLIKLGYTTPQISKIKDIKEKYLNDIIEYLIEAETNYDSQKLIELIKDNKIEIIC